VNISCIKPSYPLENNFKFYITTRDAILASEHKLTLNSVTSRAIQCVFKQGQVQGVTWFVLYHQICFMCLIMQIPDL
jgi:hypothetical protein